MAATLQLFGTIVIPSYILTPLVGSNAVLLFGLAGALCLVAVVCIVLLPEVMAPGRKGNRLD